MSTGSQEPSARVLLAAGTKTYRHGAKFAEPLVTLEGVPDALRQVVRTLTGLGYKSELKNTPGYVLDPSSQRLKKATREVVKAAPVVVIYYTGHGLKLERTPYYLITAESQPSRLSDTALQARQLLELVLLQGRDGEVLPDQEQPQVLVILDCCFAGAGAIDALRDSLQSLGNPKVWVLASASSVEYAQEGRFAAAFSQALLNPDVGSSQQFLGLDWLADKVNSGLRHASHKARYFPPRGESIGLPPFFPNPMYIPGVAGLTVDEQHWVSRLRGMPADTTTTGFYITGRTGRIRIIKDLAEWMNDSNSGGLAIVTGSPGSGKSTMLALPVLFANIRRSEDLTGATKKNSLLTQAADAFDGLPVTGIHARGMNPYQAAHVIAKNLGLSTDSPEELLEDLEDPPDDATSRIIVVDAIDEARDPRRLFTDLLLPLARRPWLRIVAGSRRHVIPRAADIGLLIDLDSDDYRDPQALVDYAQQILVGAHEPDTSSSYREQDPRMALTVATAIAKKATAQRTATGQSESFLLAQLLARAVRGRHAVLDFSAVDWTDQLPADVGTAFDEELGRLGKRKAIAYALLEALAWAKGPGLPWESIWLQVAQTMGSHSRAKCPQLNDGDVRWLLKNAGAYVAEDVGPGQRSVFRPFHDLLAAHLREQPTDEQISTSLTDWDAWERLRRQTERNITRALFRGVPKSPDGRANWQLSHPYVRTYIAQHAHSAGSRTFASLVRSLDYLAIADPAILTPIMAPTDPTLGQHARPYRRARPLFGNNPSENAAYLQEAIVALNGRGPLDQGIRPTYQTLMAHVRQDDSLLTLTTGSGSAPEVAYGLGANGRPLLAGVSGDAMRLWDPIAGALVGEPLNDPDASATSIAFGADAQGAPLLASGGQYGVQFWDSVAGTPLGRKLRRYGVRVTSIAFGTGADGKPLLAAGDSGGMVQLWDPVTGDPLGEALDGNRRDDDDPHIYEVCSVAFGVDADGRPLLASGHEDGMVWLWDPVTGARADTQLDADFVDGNAVLSVAFGADVDGEPLLATTNGAWVYLWNPSTGDPIANLFGHADGVRSVAFGTGVDGKPLLATAGGAIVQLWDPITGKPIGGPLYGHSKKILSVTFGVGPDKRPLLASSGDDRTVRLWETNSSRVRSVSRRRFPGPERSLAFGSDADGRPLLVSGGSDGTLRLWDPVNGEPLGAPLHAHALDVWAVAVGKGDDGRPLLASASGKTVRLWDIAGRGPVGLPLYGHSGDVRALALGVGADGHPVLASGGSDGVVRLWDPITGRSIGRPLYGRARGVLSLAFGADASGRSLLASGGSDGTVQLWDPANGRPMGDPLRAGRVRIVKFGTSPDNRTLLAVGGDTSVRLWDPVTRQPIGDPLTGHTDRVQSLAFGVSVDGRPLLASGSTDRTVRLWDLATRSPVITLQRRTAVAAVAMDGDMIAIADDEGLTILQLLDDSTQEVKFLDQSLLIRFSGVKSGSQPTYRLVFPDLTCHVKLK